MSIAAAGVGAKSGGAKSASAAKLARYSSALNDDGGLDEDGSAGGRYEDEDVDGEGVEGTVGKEATDEDEKEDAVKEEEEEEEEVVVDAYKLEAEMPPALNLLVSSL